MTRIYEWGPQFHAVVDELLEQGVRIIVFIDADQMANEVFSIQWLIPEEARIGSLPSNIHVLAFARSTTTISARWPMEPWCTWLSCKIDTKNAADLAITMAVMSFYEREINYRKSLNISKEFTRYIIASHDNFGGNAVSAISSFPECRAYAYYDTSYDLSVIICLDALEYQDINLHPQSKELQKYLLERIAIIVSNNWKGAKVNEFNNAIKNISDKMAIKNLMEKSTCARIIDEVIILRDNERRQSQKKDAKFEKMYIRAILEARKNPLLAHLKLQ